MRGLYELLLTEALHAKLGELPGQLANDTTPLRPAEAADRIALHLGRVIERVIQSMDDKDRVRAGVALARRLVEVMGQSVQAESGAEEMLRFADSAVPAPARKSSARDAEALLALQGELPVEAGQVLRAILAKNQAGENEVIPEPRIPLLDTTLLTNAPGEPSVGSELRSEIASADRIDVVMAFIRWSGLRDLLEALRLHVQAGRTLRVLTTIYTDSTEAKALDALQALGAQVCVSYDVTSTRLHAKAWLFHRESGFSTAYIGSSNLSNSAQVMGLEWNVRVSGARNPSVIDKVTAVFESYWQSRDFRPYDREEFLAFSEAARKVGPGLSLPPTEIRLEPFQERLLELIALAREEGRHQNLLVSATGTGKTVMAAIDYARLRQTLPRARLLFVAHLSLVLQKRVESGEIRLS